MLNASAAGFAATLLLTTNAACACEKVSLADSQVLSREQLKTVVCRNATVARDFLSGKRGRKWLEPEWRMRMGELCKRYALHAEQKYVDRFKETTGCTDDLSAMGFTP